MADYNEYPNGEPIGRGAGANAPSLPAFTVFEHTLDTAERNLGIGDTVTEFIKLPAGSFVLGAAITVLTAQATVTVDVGDSTDPNGFIAAQSTAATGRFAGAGALLVATVAPSYYDADEWVGITIGGAAAATAKFRVALLVGNTG